MTTLQKLIIENEFNEKNKQAILKLAKEEADLLISEEIEGIEINENGDVCFDFSQAELDREAISDLDEIATRDFENNFNLRVKEELPELF